MDRVDVVADFQLTAAHGAAAKAMLRARLKYGAKRGFATYAGVSQTHLARMLSDGLYGSYEAPVRVTETLAEAAVAVLDFSQDEADEFFRHVELARRGTDSLVSVREGTEAGTKEAERLLTLHAAVAREPDAAAAGEGYRLLDRLVHGALLRCSARNAPAAAAQLHLIANDIDCILARHGDAVFNADSASMIGEELTTQGVPSWSSQAKVARALALHELGDDKGAMQLLKLYGPSAPGPWRREAQLRVIKYSAGVASTPLHDIDRRIDEYLETSSAEPTLDEATAFLRAYLALPRGQRADSRVESWLRRATVRQQGDQRVGTYLEAARTLGVVKRVVFLRAVAQALLRLDSRKAGQRLKSEAYRQAEAGKLVDQLNLLRSASAVR